MPISKAIPAPAAMPAFIRVTGGAHGLTSGTKQTLGFHGDAGRVVISAPGSASVLVVVKTERDYCAVFEIAAKHGCEAENVGPELGQLAL